MSVLETGQNILITTSLLASLQKGGVEGFQPLFSAGLILPPGETQLSQGDNSSIEEPSASEVQAAQKDRPDLVVRNLSAQLKKTGSLRLRGEIFNQGTSVAQPSIAKAEWNGKSLTPTISSGVLLPGATEEFDGDFRPEEGDVIINWSGDSVEVTADSPDDVEEENEENNSTIAPVKTLPVQPNDNSIFLPFVIK